LRIHQGEGQSQSDELIWQFFFVLQELPRWEE